MLPQSKKGEKEGVLLSNEKEVQSVIPTMSPYLFLQADYDRLRKEIDHLMSKRGEIGKEVGLWVDQSSESWHDNFGYEEAQRQYLMLAGRINELKAILEKSEIIGPPDSPEKAVIGTRVTWEESGKERTITLGSYLTFEGDAVSYHAPLGKLLLGKKVGDTVILPNGTQIQITKIT
jgi:transcription elongation GreA/GreB family factor